MEKKIGLHPRNKHTSRYDFKELTHSLLELKPFVFKNKFGDESIDFANPLAVKMLNTALLKFFYNVNYWDVPKNYLCPPIPGRADYIHHAADLLAKSNNSVIPKGDAVRVLDIGVGANCIYPLMASHEYQWNIVGTEIDAEALKNAQTIISKNQLDVKISLRLQTHAENIFTGIISENESFDLIISNPPFHSSLEEASVAGHKKVRNLERSKKEYTQSEKKVLNFGGQNNELWCVGGEAAFIGRMIKESLTFKNNVLWFTSLVSKATTLPALYEQLKSAGVSDFKTIDMAQGHKKSRLIAWTFKNQIQQQLWFKEKKLF
jgi:23S rRNA (adenine1618-N6)-methyltransferase